MDPALFSNLPNSISQVRLEPYLAACSGDMNQALRLYTWNIEASASFWGEMHVLEISLRNSIHDEMTSKYGKADWWTDPHVKLTYAQQQMLKKGIAHHEPIFTRFLIGDHNLILRISRYIDVEISDYIKSHSRVVDCLRRRDRAVIEGFETSF